MRILLRTIIKCLFVHLPPYVFNVYYGFVCVYVCVCNTLLRVNDIALVSEPLSCFLAAAKKPRHGGNNTLKTTIKFITN